MTALAARHNLRDPRERHARVFSDGAIGGTRSVGSEDGVAPFLIAALAPTQDSLAVAA